MQLYMNFFFNIIGADFKGVECFHIQGFPLSFFANERLKSHLAKQATEGMKDDQLKNNRKYWRIREKGESNSPKHSCNCVDPFVVSVGLKENMSHMSVSQPRPEGYQSSNLV